MLLKVFYYLSNYIIRGFNKLVVSKMFLSAMKCHGSKCTISKGFFVAGISNVTIGSNVAIGLNNVFYCTKAPILIGDYVMTGPNVTIITGDHRIDVKDRAMMTIHDDEKLSENDVPVTIEDDVWIGANVTILKGVTIHTGAVIAAGSVVTKDVEKYSVYGGIPAKKIRDRFNK